MAPRNINSAGRPVGATGCAWARDGREGGGWDKKGCEWSRNGRPGDGVGRRGEEGGRRGEGREEETETENKTRNEMGWEGDGKGRQKKKRLIIWQVFISVHLSVCFVLDSGSHLFLSRL